MLHIHGVHIREGVLRHGLSHISCDKTRTFLFSQECEMHWCTGRRLCGALSLTGKPCLLQPHTSDTEQSMGHNSKVVYSTVDATGLRRQVLLSLQTMTCSSRLLQASDAPCGWQAPLRCSYASLLRMSLNIVNPCQTTNLLYAARSPPPNYPITDATCMEELIVSTRASSRMIWYSLC